MAPTLYGVLASPPVRAILLCSKALDLNVDFKVVDLFKGEHLKEPYLKINPAGTVPSLVEDDGFVVGESHAIITYLASKYGKDGSLYPKDLRKRAKVDERLHFHNGTLFAKAAAISRPIALAGKTTVAKEDQEGLRRAFQTVESFLKNSKYIAGDELTVADFSIATTLDSYAFFEPIDESKYPNMHAYMKRMESLPYFKAAIEEGRNMFVALMKSKMNL